MSEEKLTYSREKLSAPQGVEKILLHSCCATCSGEIMEAMKEIGLDVTVFYYNPNIYPREEYEKRKADNKRFAEKLGMPFFDADYDNEAWLERVKGLENEPERGARCTKCFDMRLERTALYAHENAFPVFATSLGISRWKNLEQVNDSGRRAATSFENLQYWDYNWRKQGGADRRIVIAKREGFYQQKYCGCMYSLKTTQI